LVEREMLQDLGIPNSFRINKLIKELQLVILNTE
jgi:hypothetical protein